MEEGKSKGLWQQMLEHIEANPPTKSEDMTLKEVSKIIKYIYDTPRQYEGSTICGRMIVTDDKPIGLITCILDECSVCEEFKKLLTKENKYE